MYSISIYGGSILPAFASSLLTDDANVIWRVIVVATLTNFRLLSFAAIPLCVGLVRERFLVIKCRVVARIGPL